MENIMSALTDGVVITLVGMFVVFAFLTIMVYAMNITTCIVNYLNEKFPPVQKEVQPQKKKASVGEEELVAVAIASILNRQRG